MTIKIPAIQGIQGNRVFYSCLIPFEALEHDWFLRSEPAADKAQRPAIPAHIRAIEEYLTNNINDYVVGSLTFAVDSELSFEVTDSNKNFTVGYLHLDERTTLHSLDGQHRLRAIISLIKTKREVRHQGVGILIYVEPDLSKKKQMFSDMNSTPRKVPKGLNITFDNRDPFGRAAKKLVLTHPLLLNRTEMFASRVLSNSNNFYSLSSIQDTLKKLHVGSIGRVKNLERFSDDLIVKKGEEFFNSLHNAREEFNEALSSQIRLRKLRSTTILFNSTTLRVIAGAYYLMEKDWSGSREDFGASMINRLAKVDFRVNSKIFVKSGFLNANSATPNARNQQVSSGTIALFDALRKMPA